jgi:SP family xylose:H+ symportor-like MFS transporter
MKLAKVSNSHIQAVTGTTFVSTMSSLLLGYTMAAVSGVVGAIDQNFISPREMSATASQLLLGLAVSSALIGTIIGAPLARRLVHSMGRKRPMILAAVLFLVSALGSAMPEAGFAPIGEMGPDALWPFIFYRMLGGVAGSLTAVVAPMYVAEFTPSAVRGQLGAYQQIAIAGGIVMALFVNWGIGLQGDDVWVLESGWRYMMVSLAIPSLAFFWLSFTVPESPKWLVMKGRIEQARRQLSRSADPEEVRVMLADLAAVSPGEKPAPLLSFGVRVLLVGAALSVFQQFVGLSAVSFYGPMILESMGYQMDAALLGVVIARSLNLLATMMVVLIVDRVGRKPLLIFGALLMGTSMIVLGSMFHMQSTGVLGLVAICCYMTGLGISFGPVVWILLSEIFPGPIRGHAHRVSVSAQWGANLIVSGTFPLLFGNAYLNSFSNQGFAFWIYGACGLLAAIFVLRFVPETKGIDSERLEAFWRRHGKGDIPHFEAAGPANVTAK